MTEFFREEQIFNKIFDKTKRDGQGAIAVFSDDSSSQTTIKKIMEASDRKRRFTWIDPGTKHQRIGTIEFSAVSVSATQKVVVTYSYTFVSKWYVLDQEQRAELV